MYGVLFKRYENRTLLRKVKKCLLAEFEKNKWKVTVGNNAYNLLWFRALSKLVIF